MQYNNLVQQFLAARESDKVLTSLIALYFNKNKLHTTLHFSMLTYQNLYREWLITTTLMSKLEKWTPFRFEILHDEAPFKAVRHPKGKVLLVEMVRPAWLDIVLNRWNGIRWIPHVTIPEEEWPLPAYGFDDLKLEWNVKPMTHEWAEKSLITNNDNDQLYLKNVALDGNIDLYNYNFGSLDSEHLGTEYRRG